MLALLPLVTSAAEPDEALVNGLAASERFFLAEIAEIRIDGSNLVAPPSMFGGLVFREIEPLRGAAASVRFGGHREGDGWTVGERYLVVATDESGWVLQSLRPATPEVVAAARLAATLPIGWRLEGGERVSPWAALGEMAAGGAGPVCARSGRPAWTAGGAELVVEQVPPEVLSEYRNPFGDGRFRVKVRNPTAAPLEVPALRCDAGGIRWADSLLVLTDRPHPLAPTLPPADTRAVVLAPGEEVAATVDAFAVPGIRWYVDRSARYHLLFALGDRAAQSFLYFHLQHHGPMQQARLGGPLIVDASDGRRPECARR